MLSGEELRARLKAEMEKPFEPKVITVDEYRYHIEQASFQCPKRWDHRDCAGHSCPKRPYPCNKCSVEDSVKWARDKYSLEEFMEKIDSITRDCVNCPAYIEYREDITYYWECRRAKHSKLQLHLVQEGSTVIVTDPHSGFEAPTG